jgi:hypothetical protein
MQRICLARAPLIAKCTSTVQHGTVYLQGSCNSVNWASLMMSLPFLSLLSWCQVHEALRTLAEPPTRESVLGSVLGGMMLKAC